jgi:hypothetical protein
MERRQLARGAAAALVHITEIIQAVPVEQAAGVLVRLQTIQARQYQTQHREQ